MIGKLPDENRRKEASALLEEVRSSIDPDYRMTPAEKENMSGEELLEHYLVPQRVREKVVGIILGLD